VLPGASLIGVEGMGRVFTHQRGLVHTTRRRHDDFVTAVDPDLPVLHHLQHEFATRALRPR
jgi:hypothetical protein